MSSDRDTAANRRRFLQYLASSPLLAAGSTSAIAETLLPKTKLPDPLMWGPLDASRIVKTPKEAINVFDLEPVCRQNVPPAHFGYMASGIDDEEDVVRVSEIPTGEDRAGPHDERQRRQCAGVRADLSRVAVHDGELSLQALEHPQRKHDEPHLHEEHPIRQRLGGIGG